MQALALRAGVPRNSIVPVKNYSTEYEPSLAAGILILRGVYEALNCATDYLRKAAEGAEFDTSGEFKKFKVTPAVRKSSATCNAPFVMCKSRETG